MRAKAVLLALWLAACGEPVQESTEPPGEMVAEIPAQPASPMSIHDSLIDCAGAIAAWGNVDPLVEPSTGTREENTLWTVLALMAKEPGLFGVTGREAAARSKTIGQAKDAPERAARAAECMQRFGGG